ncbi:Methyltransferase ausD, partial [Lachnellula suecica]
MADLSNQTSKPQLGRSSKENRWYFKEIANHLPASRQLLEQYSRIAPQDVDSHVYKLSQAPYPCVGEFKFLTLHLPSHPLYPTILTHLSPTPSRPQPKLLDLGCCVGQELRGLAHAGIPSQNLYGSDLRAPYLSTSYALFKDRATFHGPLVPADIFSPTLFEQELAGWESTFDVVHAGLFLHLFSRPQQLHVCEKIVRLMNPAKGSLFVGEMVGCLGWWDPGAGERSG